MWDFMLISACSACVNVYLFLVAQHFFCVIKNPVSILIFHFYLIHARSIPFHR